MNSSNTIEQIASATSNLARLAESRDTLVARLSAASAHRAEHARDVLLNGAAPSKAWSKAIVDEAQARELLADADALRTELQAALTAAQRRAEAKARDDEQAIYKAAFTVRLKAIMNQYGIAAPRGEYARFEENVLKAYNWLASVFRTPAVNRKRAISYFLDEMIAARHGAVCTDELIAAAYMHGDIVVENGKQPWEKFLGLDVHSGSVANSVPLAGVTGHTVAAA